MINIKRKERASWDFLYILNIYAIWERVTSYCLFMFISSTTWCANNFYIFLVSFSALHEDGKKFVNWPFYCFLLFLHHIAENRIMSCALSLSLLTTRQLREDFIIFIYIFIFSDMVGECMQLNKYFYDLPFNLLHNTFNPFIFWEHRSDSIHTTIAIGTLCAYYNLFLKQSREDFFMIDLNFIFLPKCVHIFSPLDMIIDDI